VNCRRILNNSDGVVAQSKYYSNTCLEGLRKALNLFGELVFQLIFKPRIYQINAKNITATATCRIKKMLVQKFQSEQEAT
jgi:hypothetical protein